MLLRPHTPVAALLLLMMRMTVCVARKGHTHVGEPLALPVSGAACGRTYEGIGGLINSDAPWLKGFPAKQRSDILDVLFKPQWAGSLQVLKLEIGGDGHSTINTESSHMHTEDDPPSFKRGWIFWLLQEARQRNPDLKVGGLAWSWPGWTRGSVDKKVSYLVTWAKGMQANYNVTVDFMGLQNEATITGGNPAFGVALRTALDTAGFTETLIDCCDSHSFSFLTDLTNHSSPFFKAVGALAVHEPLRMAESVPQAALDTGKPIWSSESYTTYSDANGGGCWARAINWGYVKGNVTRHIAWNLIQAYPFLGDGMNYQGHGLMWATVPWAGHYVVNPPIWISAHYTQATQPGWSFLPVGAGSGMLPSGGSYVSLVSNGGCGASARAKRSGGGSGSSSAAGYTLVVQTMEHKLSQCFKDTHPPFDVQNQTATFKIDPDLLETLPKTANSKQRAGGVSLYARRTQLVGSDKFDPFNVVPQAAKQGTYFEAMPPIPVHDDGTFTIALGINQVWTLSTVPMHRGDDSPGSNLGLASIPDATPFPQSITSALAGFPVDSPLIDATVAIDQQGVWESAKSRDTHWNGTTMQQVIPEDCDEWHAQKLMYPHTFIGACADLSHPVSIAAEVLPPTFEDGWVGVGIGGQQKHGTVLKPAPGVLAYWSNGNWAWGAQRGTAAAPPQGWVSLAVHYTAGNATAVINGVVVATAAVASVCTVNDPFAFLASSWSKPFVNHSSAAYGAGARTLTTRRDVGVDITSNAEFKSVQVNLTAQALPLPTPPSPSPLPPSPPPPGPNPTGRGLVVAACNAADPRQQWTFSGEDGGEAGTLRASSNASLCMDVTRYLAKRVLLGLCSTTTDQAQMWTWSSSAGKMASVCSPTCHVASNGHGGTSCHQCLDDDHVGGIGLFDCKSGDGNQLWTFNPAEGASLLQKKGDGRCLQANPQ